MQSLTYLNKSVQDSKGKSRWHEMFDIIEKLWGQLFIPFPKTKIVANISSVQNKPWDFDN